MLFFDIECLFSWPYYQELLEVRPRSQGEFLKIVSAGFLHAGCILPIFLYGAETWSLTVILSRMIVWIIGALDISWTYIGRNLSPMMRYAPALGSHFYQTLSAAVICPSLDISTQPTPDRIITELSRPALRAHLTTGDGGLVIQDNPGSEPWRPTCNLWILDWLLISLAETRSNGYVVSDMLLKRERTMPLLTFWVASKLCYQWCAETVIQQSWKGWGYMSCSGCIQCFVLRAQVCKQKLAKFQSFA